MTSCTERCAHRTDNRTAWKQNAGQGRCNHQRHMGAYAVTYLRTQTRLCTFTRLTTANRYAKRVTVTAAMCTHKYRLMPTSIEAGSDTSKCSICTPCTFRSSCADDGLRTPASTVLPFCTSCLANCTAHSTAGALYCLKHPYLKLKCGYSVMQKCPIVTCCMALASCGVHVCDVRVHSDT